MALMSLPWEIAFNLFTRTRMKNLIILFVFFAGQLQAQNSNLSLVVGATSGGTWSPLLSAGTTGTTYTFTPNADNATVSVTEIDDLLRVKYSHVIINTVCSACTQSGQIDFTTALSSYNQNGVLNSKTVTFNASADVNIGNPVTLRSTTTYAGNLGSLSLVINTPGNINVTAEILLNNTSEVGSSVILTQGGSVNLNSTAGAVKVTGNINCSGTINTTNSGLYNGAGGGITINGAAGVSISGALISTGRSNFAGNILVSDGYAMVTNAGQNDGISGVMSGGAFKKMGSGTLKVSGTNNAVSSSELADGTLQLAGGAALPDYNTLSFTGANTTLDLNGVSESIGSISSTNGYGKVTSSVAGNITLTVGLSNFNTVYTGLIEDGLGVLSLAKYGENFSLGNSVNNTANTYSGITTIYAGTLSIYNSRSLGSTSGGTVVRGTGKLALYNNINVGAEDLTLNLNGVSLSNVSGNNTYGGAISLGQNTTINSTAGSLTLTQTMTGTNVSLSTTGAGSLTLSGTLNLGSGGITNNMGIFSLYSANNYSGATTVSSGTLHIRNSGALGSNAVNIAMGGSLQVQGGISISNALTIKGIGPLGNGAIQSVAGTNTLNGTITLTGDTRIHADLTSQLSVNSNLAVGAVALTVGGAGNVLLNGSLSGSGSLAYTWGTSPNQLNVATSLIKDGTGSLTLNSVNSFTGATVLSGGFVILGASEIIANNSAFLFNGGSLRTGGFSETVGNVSLLADGSTIELGANAHTLRFGPRQYLDYKILTIKGWLGTAGSAGSSGRIFIEPTPLLKRSEYEQIKFTYYATVVNAGQLSTGELTINATQVARYSNVRFTNSPTSGGNWSENLSSLRGGYVTFTPTADNANVNVADIDFIIRTKYTSPDVTTACSACTQSGVVDINTPIITYNGYGPIVSHAFYISANSDVNIDNPISMRNPNNYFGNAGYLSLVIGSYGNIYVNADISMNANPVSNASGTNLTDGGNVYLYSYRGSIYVYRDINVGGAINSANPSQNSGMGGSLLVNGYGGVSVYGNLISSGRYGVEGNVTVTSENRVITTGYGTNDGVMGVISGRNFYKRGVGTIYVGGVNQIYEAYLYGGTLKAGVASAFPTYCSLHLSGGNLHDGGFNQTFYKLHLEENGTITLGNTAHTMRFSYLGFISPRLLTFAISEGTVADAGLTAYGAHTASSTVFVNVFGKKQSAVIGGVNRFGTVLSTVLGSVATPVRVLMGFDLNSYQLPQYQFYNSSLAKYYTATTKPYATNTWELLPLAPK